MMNRGIPQFIVLLDKALLLAKEIVLERPDAEVEFLDLVKQVKDGAREYRVSGHINIEYESILRELDEIVYELERTLQKAGIITKQNDDVSNTGFMSNS